MRLVITTSRLSPTLPKGVSMLGNSTCHNLLSVPLWTKNIKCYHTLSANTEKGWQSPSWRGYKVWNHLNTFCMYLTLLIQKSNHKFSVKWNLYFLINSNTR
uniref:Uncharacterized protein n=1 Tax=Pseudocercospora mori TaxID=1341201 RepID=A0A2L1K2L5_9PEZI|nr:hypothetical protein [Pseudocercospora mori]AVE15075.1 hypothetical protein [Pseudocercospora mori]